MHSAYTVAVWRVVAREFVVQVPFAAHSAHRAFGAQDSGENHLNTSTSTCIAKDKTGT
jgi:hypothetical protein